MLTMRSLTLEDLLCALAAFVLCTIIGMERQLRRKPAGVRTHALVGLGSCLFTLVSIHGMPVFESDPMQWDGSRIAAQVVSGVGFLGAGVIFVNRDAIRGLTTAATVWLAAAVGMACGANLIPMAALFTLLHFVVIFLVSPLLRRLPNAEAKRTLRIRYTDGRGALRRIMMAAGEMRFDATIDSTRQVTADDWEGVEVRMRFRGALPLRDLMVQLSELPDVKGVLLEAEDDAD